MNEKPHNVEDAGEEVWVKAWLTHYWQDGQRHPILYVIDGDEISYDIGLTATNVHRSNSNRLDDQT